MNIIQDNNLIKRTSKKYIQSVLSKNKSWKILDIGCGYSANELATTICDVQDLSKYYKDRNFIKLEKKKLPFDDNQFDFVIANGDCRLFKYAKSNKNILFSHSLQSLEKFLRKKQLISYMKYKPKVCFISNYHQKNRSKLLYLFGSIHLRWSVDDLFLNTLPTNNTNNELAIFSIC